MEDITQQAFKIHYDFPNQMVNFVDCDGEPRISIHMDTIMQISSEVRLVYTCDSDIKRTIVKLTYAPITNNEDKHNTSLP